MSRKVSIWIGYDPRELDAYAVARRTANIHCIKPIPVRGVVLAELRERGLYRRPTSIKDGRLWDDISEAPMATEFAISRFLVKELAGSGWALFIDSDMLVRHNLDRLFESLDRSKAVMVVKHHHEPPEGLKMDGQAQTRYARKNWSSVMAFNCDHPANRALTVDLINTVPGRDLHRFCWLDDELIGGLDPKWNYLVGHTKGVADPGIVHFTEGTPAMAGYEDCEFADEWRAELLKWAA
jgi:hypothetical protein